MASEMPERFVEFQDDGTGRDEQGHWWVRFHRYDEQRALVNSMRLGARVKADQYDTLRRLAAAVVADVGAILPPGADGGERPPSWRADEHRVIADFAAVKALRAFLDSTDTKEKVNQEGA